MKNTNQIGMDVRAVREIHQKRLVDVSAMTGLSVSYLSDIERGVTIPTIATLERIASAFGMRVRIVLEFDWSIRNARDTTDTR